MTANRLYFACIDLIERPVLVVGAGPVAVEKIEGLMAARASITVVAPDGCAEVVALADRSAIRWERRRYRSNDLDGRFLVVVATGDMDLAERIYREAEERAMLVNVADVKQLCNFILPAVHREGPLAVAVSTGGASPALAQRLRSEIAALVDRSYARLAGVLANLRPWARENLPTYQARKSFFDEIVKGPEDPVALLRSADEDRLGDLIAECKASALARSNAELGAPR